MKTSLSDRLNDFLAQHEMLDVTLRDKHAFTPFEAFGLTNLVETFDLLVYPTDRLDLTLLIDRASDRQILFNRKLGQCRKDRVEFSA